MVDSINHDYIIAGGGLQAGLLVAALSHYEPQATILLIEKNERLFGNHTWSFQASDIPLAATEWLTTLPYKLWPRYQVKFPNFEKEVDSTYCSILSKDLEESVLKRADAGTLQVSTGLEVTSVESQLIRTSCGQVFQGQLAIDCRGVTSDVNLVPCGYQKFFGFEVELRNQDWPYPYPLVMDARLAQIDGFRFMYVLPFSRRRILVEQTRFSDTRFLDRAGCLDELRRYLAAYSIDHFDIIREEQGCLPMPYSADMKPAATSPLTGGYRGGWFHAATGYSLPLAVRFADAVACGAPQHAQSRILRLARGNRFQAGFSRFLNRLLFQLVAPENRWEIFDRFYRVLPDETIKRFYAHQFTKRDAARILIGSPPKRLTPNRFVQSFKATNVRLRKINTSN